MDTSKILVYGRVDRLTDLEQQILACLPGRVVQFAHNYNTSQPEVSSSIDGIIYFAPDNTPLPETLFRLEKVVNALAYSIPLVIIGNLDWKIFELGASLVLPSETSDQQIARVTSRAVLNTWWQHVIQMNQPAMIVDKHQRVIRVNLAARKQFGDDLVGKFYNVAVERGKENELPFVHPIRKVLTPPQEPMAICGTERKKRASSERLGRAT